MARGLFVGMPISYALIEGHWLLYGDTRVLAGLITATNDDGTADLVVFPPHRDHSHVKGVSQGPAPGEWLITGERETPAPVERENPVTVEPVKGYENPGPGEEQVSRTVPLVAPEAFPPQHPYPGDMGAKMPETLDALDPGGATGAGTTGVAGAQ